MRQINLIRKINNIFINKRIILLSFCGLILSCSAQNKNGGEKIIPGAHQIEIYLPKLKDQRVGVVVNQTSMIKDTHLVDTLLSLELQVNKILKIFAPEHGFRGQAADGEIIDDDVDIKTGLPIVSLYGKNKKPTAEDLKDLDLVIFDIQDVGARFYTFISTMHHVMEACAENDKKMLVFDRPNPNGHYIDGPILQPEFRSFVGMHPIPIVHGLTIGELALMINEEGWLKGNVKCDLEIIPVKNYTHTTTYSLPIKPSSNLPNDLSIALYPSLCLFEGTKISVGRGTLFPFQVIGYPEKKFGEFSFTPVSIEDMSKYPKHENLTCYGIDFRGIDYQEGFTLKYLIEFYQKADFKDKFFTDYFYKLVGNRQLMEQIKKGIPEDEIKASWQAELEAYKIVRKKYLLYPDFE